MAPSTLTFTHHHEAYLSIDPTKAELLASSKTVLITGGDRGIGAVIADSREGSYSSRVHILPVDITQKLDLENALTTVTNKIGHVDVLMQNAGYLHNLGPIDSIDFDEFWRTFEVNVKGWQIVLQAFLKVATTHATVISVTSFLSWVLPSIHATAGYAASKAALNKLIQYLMTEMMVRCGVDTVALADSLNEAALIGNFAVWLASSESTFVSGRIVEASWDVEDMRRHANAIAADPTMFSIGYLGNPWAA